MAIYDLYSKRKKRALGDGTDVFIYDEIPGGLRRQIVHIWSDAIGTPGPYKEEIAETYAAIVDVLRREYSTFQLANHCQTKHDELLTWFLAEKDPDKVLDAVELSFKLIEGHCSRYGYAGRFGNSAEITRQAIDELNVRFKEHAIGYQYIDAQIIRVDSQLIHKEAVVPALAVLRGAGFENAQDEFLSAYGHFRQGKKQEALVDCYKCLESTMKVICTKRGWSFDSSKAAAKDLVNVCLTNGLIPAYWQGHFSGLRSVLESAIATPRNRQAGHGAGAGAAPEIPDELVSYVLHMTAATVLFLAEAENRMR